MCFVGNDIISLKDNSNRISFSNYKYLQKILTEREFLLYKQEQEAHYLPYLFWTCKESVYKIVLKKGMDKGFVPHQFEVKLRNTIKHENIIYISGSVAYKKNVCFFKSQIFPEYIYTTACTNETDLSYIQNYVGTCNESELSIKIREHLKSSLAAYFKKDVEQFEILKTEKGIPYVLSFLSQKMPDISFSHDDKYFSYSLLFFQK